MTLYDKNGECKWYKDLWHGFGECSGVSYERQTEVIKAKRCAKKTLIALAELDIAGLGDYVREASRNLTGSGRLKDCVDSDDIRDVFEKEAQKNVRH
jgi:hypothetical protein